MYIDKETYFADFQVLDDDCDGLISYSELQKWIVHNIKKEKNPADSCWSIFLNNGTVIKMAHKAACGHLSASSPVVSRTGVDITELRSLLIHLYAMNIFWRHFASMSMYKNVTTASSTPPSQLASKKMDEEEFAIAVRGLCHIHAGERLTDEQIRQDFMSIDSNLSGMVGFVQLATYCCTYIDNFKEDPPPETPCCPITGQPVIPHCIATKRVTMANNHTNMKASKVLGISTHTLQTVGETDDDITFENSCSDLLTDSIDQEVMTKMLSPKLSVKSLTNVMGELKNGPKQIFAGISVEERTVFAFTEMRNKLNREDQDIAKFHEALRLERTVIKDARSVTLQGSDRAGDRSMPTTVVI